MKNLPGKKSERALWFLISVILLAFVILSSDPPRIMEEIVEADIRILLLALLFANVPLFVQAALWRRMLGHGGLIMRYGRMLRYSLAGAFFNNITPAGYLGGQPVVSYMISRDEDMEFEKILGSIVSADAFNFMPVFLFAAISIMLLSPVTGFYMISLLLAGLGIYRYRRSVPVTSQVLEKDFMGIRNRLSKFGAAVKLDERSRKSIPFLVILSFTAFASEVFSVYLVGVALGLGIPLILLFFIMPLSRIANYAPTPGGSGAFEFALAGMLMFFTSVNYAEGVAVALVYRAITYYLGLLAGFVSINLPGFRKSEYQN